MIHHRKGKQLDAWLAQVTASQIRELQSFVLGVERDKAAVVAGLTLSQNNGMVEGKINKLKLIKRMMFGRAEFPSLPSTRLTCFVIHLSKAGAIRRVFRLLTDEFFVQVHPLTLDKKTELFLLCEGSED